jgi:hypothetical protein
MLRWYQHALRLPLLQQLTGKHVALVSNPGHPELGLRFVLETNERIRHQNVCSRDLQHSYAVVH